jgi:hypothetical protein
MKKTEIIKVKHYVYDPDKALYIGKMALYDAAAYKRLPNYVFGEDEIENISAAETTLANPKDSKQMQRDRAAIIKALCAISAEDCDEEIEIGYLDKYMRVIKGPLMELFLLLRPIKIGWSGVREKMFASTIAKIKALEGAEFSSFRVVDGIVVAVFHGGTFPPYNDSYGGYHKAERIPKTDEMWIAFS